MGQNTVILLDASCYRLHSPFDCAEAEVSRSSTCARYDFRLEVAFLRLPGAVQPGLSQSYLPTRLDVESSVSRCSRPRCFSADEGEGLVASSEADEEGETSAHSK